MNISVISVPWDSGHYRKRMGKGPIHLINKGLIDYLSNQGHIVEDNECSPMNDFTTDLGSAKELNTSLAQTIRKARNADRFPIILTGNCNMAIGVVTGLNLTQPGVVWFDAHADFNTPETSSSGFFDAMGLSVLTGNSWRTWRKTIPGFAPVEERNVVLVGARDFDVEEKDLLKSSEINFIPVSRIRNEPKSALTQPIEILSGSCNELYVHIDLDVLDPSELKANEFFAENGLFLSEIKNVLTDICSNFKIAAISFTSYDPTYDDDRKGMDIVIKILDTVLTTYYSSKPKFRALNMNF